MAAASMEIDTEQKSQTVIGPIDGKDAKERFLKMLKDIPNAATVYPYRVRRSTRAMNIQSWYAFADLSEMLATIKQWKDCYEFVTGTSVPFLDIEYYDDKITSEAFLVVLRQTLLAYLAKLSPSLTPDLIIATSHGFCKSKNHNKLSYHVLIRGMGYFPDVMAVQPFAEGLVKYIEEQKIPEFTTRLDFAPAVKGVYLAEPTVPKIPIDLGIYKKDNTTLRTLHSCKPDEAYRPVIKLTDHADELFVISFIANETGPIKLGIHNVLCIRNHTTRHGPRRMKRVDNTRTSPNLFQIIQYNHHSK